MGKRIKFLVLFVIGVLCTPLQAAKVLIGTGSISGDYDQLGWVICRTINRHTPGIDCRTHETSGSTSNLTNVQSGSLELGIARSDKHYHAVSRTGSFEFMDASYDRIRSLFSLHVDPFTIVALKNSGILHIDDLKGKRINIGNPGSEQRIAMEVVMVAKGWTKKNFQLATELSATQQSLSLCHNRVQAIVSTKAHPNELTRKALALCNANLVDISGSAIDGLVEKNAYYEHTVIPSGVYGRQENSTKTFGLLATVITSTDVDADLVYQIVKGLFEHFDGFRRMHKSFGSLTPQKMITEGLSAPLHEGALRYYREKGWM